MQLRRLAVFAQWRDEAAVERFLADDPLGRQLAEGWHVRLRVPASVVDAGCAARSAGARRRRGSRTSRSSPSLSRGCACVRCPGSCGGASRSNDSSATTRASRSRSPPSGRRARSRPSRSGAPCARWRRWCAATPPSRIRSGTPPRWPNENAATSTTSSPPIASGRSRSTAPGRAGPASCRRAPSIRDGAQRGLTRPSSRVPSAAKPKQARVSPSAGSAVSATPATSSRSSLTAASAWPSSASRQIASGTTGR